MAKGKRQPIYVDEIFEALMLEARGSETLARRYLRDRYIRTGVLIGETDDDAVVPIPTNATISKPRTATARWRTGQPAGPWIVGPPPVSTLKFYVARRVRLAVTVKPKGGRPPD